MAMSVTIKPKGNNNKKDFFQHKHVHMTKCI